MNGSDTMRRSIVEQLLQLLGTGKIEWNDVQSFITGQLQAKNIEAISAFFSKIAQHKDRSLNKLVDRIVRLPEWSDFVLDLREEVSVAKLDAGEPEPPVQFLVSFPRRMYPGLEATMMVHVYAPRYYREQSEDGGGEPPVETAGRQVVITPKLQGCEFSPRSRSFQWRNDSRKVSFQMIISTRQPNFKLDRPRPGRVSFFMESVAVGEVGLQVYLASGEGKSELHQKPVKLVANPYRGVFASYALEDRDAVDAMIESVDAVLGDHYVYSGKPRPGKNWREELGDMFNHSEVFQLFWTPNARKSEKVKREWTQVLQCKKACLIRPVYWIEPLRNYPPPRELERLPFVHMDI